MPRQPVDAIEEIGNIIILMQRLEKIMKVLLVGAAVLTVGVITWLLT